MRIIFATHNPHKLLEIRQIMEDVAAEILSQGDLGISFEPEEDGRTFAENAEKKAVGIREYMRGQGLLRPEDIVMADDSGLCVDALSGAPGIYSSRFMGADTSYERKNQAIIKALSGLEGEERAAHFTCNICAAFADGRIFHTEGEFPGQIAKEPRGENGFGYDPILYLPLYGLCSAELDAEEKNKISHRGKALREMRRVLRSVMENDWKLARRMEEQAAAYQRKKILLASDTHRRDEPLIQIIKAEQPFDMLIHLGDAEGTEDRLRIAAGSGVSCYFVGGNNDFFTDLPKELELSLGKHRCLLTHGHAYGVNMDVRRLSEEARARGCDIAMFGHTHKPYLKESKGVLCINPGSIGYPRQQGRQPSYMLIEMDEGGELHYTHKYLD